MAVSAFPINSIVASKLLSLNPIVFCNKVIIVATAIKSTGSKAVKTLIPKPGVSSSLNTFCSPND
ncbi:Uncharacterised protein [Streptococcus pneumoniae]|nr:Uncharacterised protein [Streptococcus pneumoniae]